MAERVAVDFVQDVAFVGGRVVEAIRVDRPTQGVDVGTGKRVV